MSAHKIPGDCLKCHRRVHTIVETGKAPYVEHVGPSCEDVTSDVEIVDGPPPDAKQIPLNYDLDGPLVGTGQIQVADLGNLHADLGEFGLTDSDVDD